MDSLSKILLTNTLRQQWSDTQAAREYAPLPVGEYVAHITEGALITGRTNGTPGYKLTFEICEGEYTGRRIWLDLWLTPAALSMTKRDLNKIGVAEIDQLERPLPAGIRCRVTLALRREDNGTEHNRVRRFDVIGIDEAVVDAFAPEIVDGNDGGGDGT